MRRPPSIGRSLPNGCLRGRDSVALLHWLRGLGYDRLILCHLEHGLRGRAGRSDARFVTDLAGQHGLVCEIGTTDVRALAAREKVSIETAARIARYAFYAKVAARRRCCTIFLGHHADDLVETFLINLFRGAGAAGLSSLRFPPIKSAKRSSWLFVLCSRFGETDRRLHHSQSDPIPRRSNE